MPLSSLQAAVVALVVAAVNAVVALQFIGESTGTRIETAVVGVVAAGFVLANSVIHAGVSRATGKDASKL